MPKRILCIVHQKHSRTRRVGRFLKRKGYELDVRRPCLGHPLPEHLDDHAGVVIFGGPQSAYEHDKFDFIRRELDWMPTALESQTPFLGICLGCQMLAQVLGGRVHTHPDGLFEVGYYPVYPTEAGAEIFGKVAVVHAYQWHKDGFEVPDSATVLAKGERFENQAFRYGQSAYGIQFHPELTPSTMELWSGFANKRGVLGAQPIEEMKVTRDAHDYKVRRWLDGFLDQWLESDARWREY